MPSPQLRRLTEVHHLPLLDQHNLDSFIRSHHLCVLFFAGNPEKYPEANDVAMVLPELLKAFGEMQGAVIAPSDEIMLQKLFVFSRWPSLVFVREGQMLGVISEIQNWHDYLIQIQGIIANNNRIATVTV